jgi:NodT family efflux transporter outer membrane factor (OMF) lipoprotein
MHAELANDYFALRGDDAAQRILDKTVIVYERALYLTRKRYEGGADPVGNVDEAQNQLDTAKTQAADMHLKRAQLEHAIAVLIGEDPSSFSLKPELKKNKLVTINPQLPSTLLERRPDIAEAELKVQAANYNIGVARAAFFPAFNLSATIGFESANLGNLLTRPSLVWALGPTAASALLNNGNQPVLSQTIFDGGRLIALSNQAYAQYCETVAEYRQTVLTAYQEVEDSLSALRQLDRENKTQTLATSAANRSVNQALTRYKDGLTTYLDVVIIQNIALQAELSTIDIRTRRQIASVQLIKALGGGQSN